MSSEISIRLCTPVDCERVLDLWKNAGSTPSPTDTLAELERSLHEPNLIFLLAVQGERIVGSVIGGWDGWRGNIYRLAVAPDTRRCGIAWRLMHEVNARLASDKGARLISALVEPAHGEAVAFWDSMQSEGYKYDPRFVRYLKSE